MSYYNQSATLRRVTAAHTSDGTPVYGASAAIKVRWEEGTARVVTSGLETAQARTRAMFTTSEVGFGDEVTYGGAVYHVAGVVTVPDLGGTIREWEAVVE